MKPMVKGNTPILIEVRAPGKLHFLREVITYTLDDYAIRDWRATLYRKAKSGKPSQRRLPIEIKQF